MLIRFGFEITVECDSAVPMLLALSTHSGITGRFIGTDVVRTLPDVASREYIDQFANRITRIVAPKGRLELWSDCVIEIEPLLDPVDWSAPQHPIAELPDEVLHFLMASRYCDSDKLVAFAWAQFGHVPEGWLRVQAICDYVHQQTTFGYKFGRSSKTAFEVNLEKSGVCRDFAHLAVSLCRALNIPARYASGYLGDIGVPYSGPGDFCAWFEAYLGGRWFTFDARYNTPRTGRLLMVRGADAADVAMITSFGTYALRHFRVWTDELPAEMSDDSTLAALETRPDGEALVFQSSGRVA